MNNSEILLYQSPDGKIKLDVRLEDETVWLTQDHMAQLFGKAKSTINEHIKNIFAEGELVESDVIKKFGISEFQQKVPNFYNLYVVISVGYRVKSQHGTRFRIWATQRLKEYIVKGFALNDDRFKSGNSMNYFTELQERIREIRLSERFFYIEAGQLPLAMRRKRGTGLIWRLRPRNGTGPAFSRQIKMN